jgi:hypothetical protein
MEPVLKGVDVLYRTNNSCNCVHTLLKSWDTVQFETLIDVFRG